MLKKIYVLLAVFCFMQTANAQIDGDNIFAETQIITIDLTFSQPGYWDSLVANYSTTTYMKADLTLTDSTGTYTFTDVGVRLKGNSSYNHPNNKTSFKIDFNKYVSGQNYDGLKKLNFSNGFKDPTLMREKVFFDVCRAAGVPAPRANFANVYMNGTLKGFYTVVEQIDDQFLDWRILDDDGNLFKAGDNFGAGPAGGGTPADLKDYGTSQSSYTDRYELKTNEDADDWSDLIQLIDFINNSSTTDFEAGIASKIELQEFLRSMAIDNLFSNLDSYVGSARNYYLYHNLTTDKWEWIKWDANETFGSYSNGVQNITSLALNYRNSDRPLLDKIFNSPTLYQQYLAEVCYVSDNFFNTTYMYNLIDDIKTLIQSSVYADNNKMYSNTDFDTNVNSNLSGGGGPGGSTTYGLKSFVQTKSTFVSGAVDCTLYNTNTTQILDLQSIKMFPNPANSMTTISWEDENVTSLQVFNAIGEIVYQENTIQKSTTDLDVSNYENGFYFIFLNTPTQRATLKLMVME